MVEPSNKPNPILCVMGMTGVGKSSTLNSLAGDKSQTKFRVEHGMSRGTTYSEI